MKPTLFTDPDLSANIVFDGRGMANLTFDEQRNGHYNLVDKNGYLENDTPENSRVLGDHSHVYIDGAVGKNALVKVRQGIVSAKSLGPNAEVISAILLIISDENLSKSSKNIAHPYDHPTILVVPEKERARVFDDLAKRIHKKSGCPAKELKEFVDANSTLPVKIIPPEYDMDAQ